MAEATFVSDEKIMQSIYELIDQAQEQIIIVSPYINLWGHLVKKLEKSQADVLFIARKNQDGKLEDLKVKMNELRFKLAVVENLHAKIYLNEKRCIISSMNLYDYSTANSREIALLIDDQNVLSEINKYIDEELIPEAELITDTASKRIAKGLKSLAGFVAGQLSKEPIKNTQQQSQNSFRRDELKGHCIRCGNSIKANPDRPLCGGCYEKWNVYKNRAFKEKYCHACGKQEQTSVEKPVCLSCYKKLNSQR